jgi:hypothetical protein
LFEANQVIEKGGYLWLIGKKGVFLEANNTKAKIIAFEKQVNIEPATLYKVNLSFPSGDSDLILIEVAKEVIKLKILEAGSLN